MEMQIECILACRLGEYLFCFFAITRCRIDRLNQNRSISGNGIHYNREFLNFFWAFLAGVFSINIESYELSCKRVVQFVNGYSKPH